MKSLSKIKENRLLQGLSMSKAVTGCFTAWLCLLLLFQLGSLLLFSGRLLSTSEHHVVRHELMGPPQAHLPAAMVKSQPIAGTQPANSLQPVALLNNNVYSTLYYETMTTDWGF